MKILIYIVAWILILVGIFLFICGGIATTLNERTTLFLLGLIMILLGIILKAITKLELFFLAIYIYLKTGIYPGINSKNKEITNISGKSLETSEEMRTIIREDGIYTVLSQDAFDLFSSFSQIDISDIASITFLPKSGKGFQVKTPNIKRLAVYISSKLGKTTFEAEELRNIYNHVIENLQSNLSKTDYNIVQGKINEFVQSGGEVKIEKNNS